MPWSLGARTGLELPMVSPRPSVTEPGSAHRLPVLPKPTGGRPYNMTTPAQESRALLTACSHHHGKEVKKCGYLTGSRSQPFPSVFTISHCPTQLFLCLAPHHMLRPHEHRSRTEPRPALRLLCPNENPTEFLKNGLGPAFTQLGIPYGITGFHLHLLMIYWELWI